MSCWQNNLKNHRNNSIRFALQTNKSIKKHMATQPIKPGPKRTATSTGKPDQRQRDNKKTPGKTPSLKPSKSSTKK